MVVTTHYMEEAEYCNRLMIMHEGQIVDVGNPEELKNRHGKSSIEGVFVTLVDTTSTAESDQHE